MRCLDDLAAHRGSNITVAPAIAIPAHDRTWARLAHTDRWLTIATEALALMRFIGGRPTNVPVGSTP